MVFKLVRIDSDEPFKIKLLPGKHLFGRGKFLDCDDKRVSRTHGELEVTDELITIKALHQNPCFYTKKETKDKQILKRDCTINLQHGDNFGLLPETYWYQILQCNALDLNATDILSVKDMNRLNDDTNNDLMTQTCNASREINFELNESTNEIAPSQSLLNGGESPSFTQNNEARDNNESPSIIRNVTEPETLQNSTDNDNLTVTNTSAKRTAEEEKVGNKRIKTEPVDDQSEVDGETRDTEARDTGLREEEVSDKVEVKSEPNIKHEEDDEIPCTSNTQDTIPIAVAPANVAPALVMRERCMYGQNCYRKNPQHLAQYSHPSDRDWGSGPAACPWGAACRRRDPRHWRDHIHPPGTQPPAANQGKKKAVPRRTRQDSESDDDELLGVVVTGTRNRRSVVMQDRSDSEQDDPYGTDDSDDWVPDDDELF